MNRTFYIVVFCILLSIRVEYVSAQDDNTVKIPIQMSIPPAASLSLAGNEAQLSLNEISRTAQILRPTSSGQVWINYSSVVENNLLNTIFVNIVSSNLPGDIAIKLKIGPDAGAGLGKVGKPSAPIYLSIQPQPIISEIGSCFTGIGPNKGHSLMYTWELQPGSDFNLKSLESQNLEVGVTYTISSGE